MDDDVISLRSIRVEIPKQVTRRKTIKRTVFNISSNLAHFTHSVIGSILARTAATA